MSNNYSELAATVAENVNKVVVGVLYDLRSNVGEESKRKNDIVTQADIAIESRLCDLLPTLVPGSVVRGEEKDSVPLEECRPEWVIDPIDGTINFARGYEMFTSVVALLEDRTPRLAVVLEPSRGATIIAVRGEGCFVSGLPGSGPAATRLVMRVGSHEPRSRLYSIMITPKLSPRAREASWRFASWTLDESLGFRVLVSQAYEATRLAAGGVSGVMSFQSSGGWTRDAARLVCEEAGGAYVKLRCINEQNIQGFALLESYDRSIRSKP